MSFPSFDLSEKQKRDLRSALHGRLLALCFGSGVDSTAMIVALKLAGLKPDVITFADTGGEKPETIAHVERMNVVLDSWGWPLVDVCRKETLPSTPYNSLYGNCLARRGFAGKVLAATGDMKTVAQLLGHSSIDCSQRYVDVDPATLEAMFANAL